MDDAMSAYFDRVCELSELVLRDNDLRRRLEISVAMVREITRRPGLVVKCSN
jgi:hypothetical protein